ncbi:MAG: methyl-accepting chemotaxis protein [Candidatus Schekmanbacteria bacterium]|nr:methyl-accepting chemotaxis protein [Candidatus Schekmanbacteria bacterium]
MSIRTKLSLALLVSALATAAAIGGFSFLLSASTATYLAGNQKSRDEDNASLRLVELAARMQNMLLRLVRQRDLEAAEELMAQQDTAAQDLIAYVQRVAPANSPVVAAMQDLSAANAKVRDAVLHGKGASAIALFVEESAPAFEALLLHLRELRNERRAEADRVEQEAQEHLVRLQLGVVVAVALLWGGAGVLGGVIVRDVSRALGIMAEHVGRVAAGDLRASVALASGTDPAKLGRRGGTTGRSRDEIGHLHRSFNHMIDNLRQFQGRVSDAFADLEHGVRDATSLAQKVQTAAERQSRHVGQIAASTDSMGEQAAGVENRMQELAELSGKASESIDSLILSIAHVADDAESLSASIARTTPTIADLIKSNQEMAQSVESLDRSIQATLMAATQIDASITVVHALAKESEQLSSKVTEEAQIGGADAVRETIAEMNGILGAVTTLSQTEARLVRSVEDIGKILLVIDDVAAMTNLLALNADIIAAQAGHHGRAFSVVATEIRELAERTRSYTGEISDVVKGIQTETRNVEILVQDGVSRVELGVRAVTRADLALKSIIDSSARARLMSARIAAATAEQALASRDTSAAILEVSLRSNDISRGTVEQAQRGEGIMESVAQMRELATKVRTASNLQAANARAVSTDSASIARLAHHVSAVASQTAAVATQAAGAAERIRETLEVFTELQQIVVDLAALSANLRKTLLELRL